MKVHELRVQHFRCFGQEARLCLPRPDGSAARVCAFTGPNGQGKTTALQLIAALLERLRGPYAAPPLLVAVEAAGGRAAMDVELGAGRGRASVSTGGPDSNRWQAQPEDLQGGALFFTHNRWFRHRGQAPITAPVERYDWVVTLDADTADRDSLAQRWAWLNYLDLEEGLGRRQHLGPAVAALESILGQRVRVKRGQVFLERQGSLVPLHELSSGETQLLILFGELSARARPGMIVLIDDLELNLHPTAQRAALDLLRAQIEDLDGQLLFSTHSPTLLEALAPEERMDLSTR